MEHTRPSNRVDAVGRYLKPWGVVEHSASTRRLYLDIDGQPWPPRVPWLLMQLRRMGLAARPPIEYTRTRNGWHVVIELTRSWPPAVIVAAQALLGSDAERERYNLFRSQRLPSRRANWNLLYAFKPEGRR